MAQAILFKVKDLILIKIINFNKIIIKNGTSRRSLKNLPLLTDGRGKTTGSSSPQTTKNDKPTQEACLTTKNEAAPSVPEIFHKVSIFVRICTNKNFRIWSVVHLTLTHPFPAGALQVLVLEDLEKTLGNENYLN